MSIYQILNDAAAPPALPDLRIRWNSTFAQHIILLSSCSFVCFFVLAQTQPSSSTSMPCSLCNKLLKQPDFKWQLWAHHRFHMLQLHAVSDVVRSAAVTHLLLRLNDTHGEVTNQVAQHTQQRA
ncbi:hypothetical protein KCU99_g203, partial [Aureobasidium melanogenum]